MGEMGKVAKRVDGEILYHKDIVGALGGTMLELFSKT